VFLGVPSDRRTVFPQINANFNNRSQFLAKIYHPRPAIYQLFMKTISLFGTRFMKQVYVLHNYIERLNRTQTSRTEMDADFRPRLVEYFRPDIEKLSRLIDQDLSAWLKRE